MIKQSCFIFLIIFFPAISTASLPSKWNNPTFLERMVKREILAFASIEDVYDKKHFKMEGAGITKAPTEKALTAIWSEHCWEKHITAVHKLELIEGDATSKILDIEASVLRLYWLKSRLKVQLHKREHKMNWEFIAGDMYGMKGNVELIPSEKGTVVTFRNDLTRNKFNLPAIVVKIALGLALKQAGWSLRSIMEAGNQDPCLGS